MTTLAAFLNEMTRALGSLSSTPRLDAELLIEHGTGRNRAAQRAYAELELSDAESQCLQELLKRRLSGEPVAYIRGQRDFWSLNLQVNPSVLIPRPETELLVERALCYLVMSKARVLDLGTGSGAIALALAKECPQAEILATDFSTHALATARANAERMQLSRVQFILSDWYAKVPTGLFDLIVSNPPYIAEADPDLQPDVLATEPRMALISGPTGLEAIQKIIEGASAKLRPGGRLLLEHGWRQGEAVRSLLVTAGFSGVASHADLAGLERVTEGQRL